MKVGDIVTRSGANDRLELVALSHPTNIGGMYYEVKDLDTGRQFYVKSYQLEPKKDYGTDVDQFNADHDYKNGCRLGRYPGSDYTECDTHHAWVKHGVPALLRDI